MLHATGKFADLLARVGHADPLCGGRLFREAEPGASFDQWPNRSRREGATAVGAHIVKHGLDATGAECAFVRADARIGRVRRQVSVAALAVRS